MMNREIIKRLLVFSGIGIVAIIIIAYSYYASHGIISGPSIVISSPSPDQTTFSTSTLLIEGTAQRVQTLSLNGEPILIDEAGHFSETVLLSQGYNAETIQGQDKFGHVENITLQVIYKPAE